MGWLIALAVLVLLWMLPLGVSVKYSGEGTVARLIAGPVRVTLYPRKKKDKEKPSKKEKKPSDSEEKKDKGGKITDFMPLLQIARDLFGGLRRKLRVKKLEMKLTLAGDDPCDLALNYGRAWAAVGSLMPLLEELFVIKKRDVDVACDFTATQTLITARVDLTITLGRLLRLGLRHGAQIMKFYMDVIKSKKGGAYQ